jgi:hypothetical protein
MEWIQYITCDPEFRLDNYAAVELPGGKILRVEQEGIAVWLAYSQEGVDQNHAWFTYFKGNISVKNPDQEIINKMVDIAQALGGKVQDDEGTSYEKENYQDKQLKEVQVTAAPRKKPRWRFW